MCMAMDIERLNKKRAFFSCTEVSIIANTHTCMRVKIHV